MVKKFKNLIPPRPWHLTDGEDPSPNVIMAADGDAAVTGFDRSINELRTARLHVVECVNALEGVNPTALHKLVQVAHMVKSWHAGTGNTPPTPGELYAAAYDALRAMKEPW